MEIFLAVAKGIISISGVSLKWFSSEWEKRAWMWDPAKDNSPFLKEKRIEINVTYNFRKVHN